MEKILYTPVAAARVLGISRSKIYELMGGGALPSVRIGACRRVTDAALRAFVEELTDVQPDAGRLDVRPALSLARRH